MAEQKVIRVPWLFGFGAMAPFPGVALVVGGQSGDDLEWTLRHEAVHHEQMRRDGWIRFTARYLVSSGWRARYEAEAFGRINLARHALKGDDVADLAGHYAAHIRVRYFPRWWPGRRPAREALTALMMEAWRQDPSVNHSGRSGPR